MEMNNCKILVLKGMEDIADITKQLLVALGADPMNIELAQDVDTAKEIVKNREIHMILAGIGNKDHEGPRLLKWIGTQGIREKVCFIFYSGGGEHFARDKTNEYGADGFILEPVGIRDFKSHILRFSAEIKNE